MRTISASKVLRKSRSRTTWPGGSRLPLHVQDLGEKANDTAAIADAIRAAQEETERPSMIILRTHIGYGAPHMQDTKEAHGQALGEEEVKLTKRFYGWPEDKAFFVPPEVLDHMRRPGQPRTADGGRVE